MYRTRKATLHTEEVNTCSHNLRHSIGVDVRPYKLKIHELLALEIIQRNYRSRPLIRQREEMHIPRGERLRIISGKRRIFPLQMTLDTQEVALGGVMPKATLDDINKIKAVRMAKKKKSHTTTKNVLHAIAAGS
jgi:hypothetical protein